VHRMGLYRLEALGNCCSMLERCWDGSGDFSRWEGEMLPVRFRWHWKGRRICVQEARLRLVQEGETRLV
jgi:hypothetical protein